MGKIANLIKIIIFSIGWILALDLHVFILPITGCGLFIFHRDLSYNGMPFYEGILKELDNLILGELLDYMILNILLFFLMLIIWIIILAIVYLLPYFVVLVLLGLQLHNFGILRRNFANKVAYNFEELFNLKHKERLSGKQWWDEKKKKSARANYQKRKAEYERNKAYDYSYEYSKRSSNNRTSENSYQEVSELKQAMILFMLDDLEITPEELKRKRNKLIKSFHPDENSEDFDSVSDAQKINDSYEVLMKYIKKK